MTIIDIENVRALRDALVLMCEGMETGNDEGLALLHLHHDAVAAALEAFGMKEPSKERLLLLCYGSN